MFNEEDDFEGKKEDYFDDVEEVNPTVSEEPEEGVSKGASKK